MNRRRFVSLIRGVSVQNPDIDPDDEPMRFGNRAPDEGTPEPYLGSPSWQNLHFQGRYRPPAVQRVLQGAPDLFARYRTPVLRGTGKLALVVGHTKGAPGAWGMGGIYKHEWFFNTELARIITSIGTDRGIQVRTYWRDSGGRPGCYRRLKSWGATAVAELHFNATGKRVDKARGPLTIGSGGNSHRRRLESHRFACMIQDRTKELLGMEGRHDYGVTRRGYASSYDIPWILTEPVFGNNMKDANLLANKREAAAGAVVEGFILLQRALG